MRWSVPGAALPDAVTSGLAVFSLGGRLEARRADTGAVAWTRETSGDLIQSHHAGPIALVVQPEGRTPADGPPPAGAQPPLPQGEVSLLDPATGKDLWKAVLPGRVDTNASAVSTRHILATYAVDYSGAGTVAALQLRDGTTAWSFPSPSGGYVTSAAGIPAVISNLDTTHASVLDPATGRTLWESSADAGGFRWAPFIEIERGTAYRRDPRTGQLLPGRVPVTYGVAAGGDLLASAADHTLTASRAADALWESTLPAGPRPISYLDVDDKVVVALTAVGQEVARG